MSDTTSKLAEAIELLNNSKSLKRESAAKRLRKMCIPESGEALLQALQKEVKDKRTWSTQYHLIAALGVVGYQEALPFLWDLTSRDLHAAILYLALGDAIFRLSLRKKPAAEVWEEVLQTHNSMFLNGALRAIALLKLVPNDATIQSIIAVASQPEHVDDVRGYPGDRSGLRYWVAVASAGWKTELVNDFLSECLLISNTSLKHAAESALRRKYVKWDY
jgi:hypothetical protein